MADKMWFRASVLLFVLGAALLGVAVVAGDMGTATVSQYTAYEVDHNGEELVLTSTHTGNEIAEPSRTVDDRVVCLRGQESKTRLCDFEEQAHRGKIAADSSLANSQFEYLYLDSEFYRANSSFDWESRPSGYAQKPTAPDEAFDDLATGFYELTPNEREVIEDGPIYSTHPLPNADRIVEYEDRYYLLTTTARKTPGDPDEGLVTSCWQVPTHDNPCSDLNIYQKMYSFAPVVLGLLGVLGIGTGALGIYRLKKETPE